MKLFHITGLVAISCGLLASCYPYREPNRKKKPRKPQVEQTSRSAEESARREADEAAAKKAATEQAVAKTEESGSQPNAAGTNPSQPPVQPPAPPNVGGGNQTPAQPGTTPTPGPKPRTEYVYANKVPGRDGFVFSPYNNKVIDVRGYTSGQLVMDPTYPPSEKKYFRVP